MEFNGVEIPAEIVVLIAVAGATRGLLSACRTSARIIVSAKQQIVAATYGLRVMPRQTRVSEGDHVYFWEDDRVKTHTYGVITGAREYRWSILGDIRGAYARAGNISCTILFMSYAVSVVGYVVGERIKRHWSLLVHSENRLVDYRGEGVCPAILPHHLSFESINGWCEWLMTIAEDHAVLIKDAFDELSSGYIWSKTYRLCNNVVPLLQ